MIGGALAPAFAILQIHVEHVDLVVITDLRAVRPEQEAAIGNLSIRARDRCRADMQVNSELAGKPGCLANDDVVLPILQHRPQTRPVALDRSGHLRRLNIGCAPRSRFAHQLRHRLRISCGVDTGANLDGGSLERHRFLSPKRNFGSDLSGIAAFISFGWKGQSWHFTSGREQIVELAGTIERMQIVAAADGNIVDDDLREGPAAPGFSIISWRSSGA